MLACGVKSLFRLTEIKTPLKWPLEGHTHSFKDAVQSRLLLIESQNAVIPGECDQLNLHSTCMGLGKQFWRRWLGDNTSTLMPGSAQVMKWPAYLTCRFMHAVINLPLLLDWCPCVF